MIERNIAPVLQRLASQYPVITLTGPRQSGKTTLARSLFSDKSYFTLEDSDTRRYATDNPRGFLTIPCTCLFQCIGPTLAAWPNSLRAQIPH